MYSLYNGVYDGGGCGYHPTFSGASLEYWQRSFFQRATALMEFKGFPTPGPEQVKWDLDAFLYGLFRMGFLAVFQSKRYGLVFQPAAPHGIGLFYQPTGMVINTPYFQFREPLQIGTQCEVIKLTPDYRGIWDIINKYASEMQYMDVAIRQSSLNARFAYAICAPDKATAQTAKAIMERLENGDPGIVVDKNMLRNRETGEIMPAWQQFDRDLKKNFILPELIEARRALIKDFYREIGIRLTSDKKEREITSEQDAQDSETFNRRQVWLQTLKETLERYNKMYRQNLSVEWREPDGSEDRRTDDDREPDRTE